MVNRAEGFYNMFGKRISDSILVILFSPLLLPLIAIVAVMVALFLGRPILFRQRRAGVAGRPFEIIKFRSMSDQRNEHDELLPDTERLSRFGRFLRALSLDELPQFYCVLQGDMSLVGPRPLPVEYIPNYDRNQARRLIVRPGVTGWAQINGRQKISFSQRMAYDTWYVDNISLVLDLRILVKTVGLVVLGKGVVSGQDTREVDDMGLAERMGSTSLRRKETNRANQNR